jgi:hypothetical protein
MITLLAAVFASALVRSTVLLTDAVPSVRGYGGGDGGGGCDGGEGGGGGGAGLHHVRIIEMSGAVVLGRPPPRRTPSSCAGLRAASHTSRSFIWPVNVPSPAQLLLPTYRLERLTGSGKRIDAVVATLTPFQ